MLNSFRCFILFTFMVGFIGLFMVVLVQVVSEPHPSFNETQASFKFIGKFPIGSI